MQLQVVKPVRPDTSVLLPLEEYDRIIVSYSGGKDSLAILLDLLERGVPKHKIELWHQHIDGEPGSDPFMDWPCTESYVKATGKAFGIPVYFQWKVGGFYGEMMRDNAPTAPTGFELGDGTIGLAGGKSGKLGTRLLFPQTSADLSVRWCSAYLKIDVAAKALNNDPRFNGKKILFLTGERRQESAARSLYATIERHRSSTLVRRVDQYRSILERDEEWVWDIIARWGVVPHPAYLLGWGRVSCLACIFGDPDQWASVRKVARRQFTHIVRCERSFAKTLKRGINIVQMAKKGTPFPQTDDAALVALAMGREYPADRLLLPAGVKWELPPGAYKHCGGPT